VREYGKFPRSGFSVFSQPVWWLSPFPKNGRQKGILNLGGTAPSNLPLKKDEERRAPPGPRYLTDCNSVNDTMLPLQRQEKKVRIKHETIRFEHLISDGSTCAKHAITTSQNIFTCDQVYHVFFSQQNGNKQEDINSCSPVHGVLYKQLEYQGDITLLGYESRDIAKSRRLSKKKKKVQSTASVL
jgi:hypothetical protein